MLSVFSREKFYRQGSTTLKCFITWSAMIRYAPNLDNSERAGFLVQNYDFSSSHLLSKSYSEVCPI